MSSATQENCRSSSSRGGNRNGYPSSAASRHLLPASREKDVEGPRPAKRGEGGPERSEGPGEGMMRICELRNLHLVTYENGLHLQQKLVALRQSDQIPDQLLLLEHPPVITLGRGGDPATLLASA